MKHFNYYLFDYDGTLCHTRDTISHAMEATFLQYQLDVPDEQIRLKAIGSGMTIYDALVSMHPEGKTLPTESLDAMVRAYRSIYGDIDGQYTSLFEGAEALLSSLKTQDKTVIVLSNKGFQTVAKSLKFFKLEQYTDLLIADGSLSALKLKMKPDPASYISVIKEQFNIQNNAEVLMTGDTYSDLLFAKNCGIKCCWASYGYGDKEACLSLNPDYVIADLMEFGK
jgi:phosphoglycolate phosphatase